MAFRWIRSDEQVVQSRYLLMLEKELAYYRLRSDQERERGDRLNDQMLVRNGEMPVTALGVGDLRETIQKQKDEWEKQQKELGEIYGDAMEEVEQDGLALPKELDEAAQKLLKSTEHGT